MSRNKFSLWRTNLVFFLDGGRALIFAVTCSPNFEWLVVPFSDVSLVYQAGNDMTICNVEVVVRAKHVARNDGSKLTAILLLKTPFQNHHECSLRILATYLFVKTFY